MSRLGLMPAMFTMIRLGSAATDASISEADSGNHPLWNGACGTAGSWVRTVFLPVRIREPWQDAVQ